MTFLTVLRPKVSTDNSTSVALNNGSTFTGAAENVVDYATITVFILTDVAGTLQIQFSTDGVNWDHTQTETIQAGVQAEWEVSVIAKFFRIQITNGSGSNQSFLRCSSLLNPYKSDTSNIVSAINNITNGGEGITFNSSAVDAFGRLKVSNPQTLADYKFLTTTLPLRWDQAVTFSSGSASATFNPSYINMTVSGNGSRVVRQSRLYTPYQSGKGLAIICTGTLTTSIGGSPNVVSRMGYFDDGADKTAEDAANRFGNGYFFQMAGSTLSVVERYYIPGYSATLPGTDNVVTRNNWNIDPMDGTGPSGIVLDPSKRQIFYIELEWLGVGTVMMGVFVNRNLYFVHRFDHANLSTGGTGLYPYISSPNLPIRYEISSTGGTGTMVQVCSTVLSDGGYSPSGLAYSIARTTPISFGATSEKVLLAFRTISTKRRVLMKIINFSLTTTSANGGTYRIYRFLPPNSGVMSPDPTWNVVQENSVEYAEPPDTTTFNKSAARYELMQTGFYNNQLRGFTIDISDLFGSTVLTSDIAGNSDMFIVTATDGNSVNAAVSWQSIE